MSDQPRRFDPAELGAVDGADAAALLSTARDLEAYAEAGMSVASAEFEDRVMAAIAAEPAPRLGVGSGVVATIVDAWRIAWGGSRPVALRAQALALLLLVGVTMASLGSLAAVGAARLLSPDAPPPSEAPTMTPSPTPTSTPTPSPSPEPSPTPSRSPSPSPTETAEPTGTDDHGGSSGSGSSGSGSSGGGSSGSGSSGGGDRTPRPTETPEPDETPEPEDTPEPDETPRPTGG